MEQIEVNVPKGWSWKKFEDVCVLKRGYDLPTHARSVGNIPLYSANGVTDYIDQFKVEGPGVVTGRSGTIGKVHFVESDFWPLNTALYVQKFNGNYPRFIKYFLEIFDLTRFSSGAAVPTLNRNSFSSELVCTPDSIDEQKRIVEKLDALLTRIDVAIEHLQESASLADALYASELNNIFSSGDNKWPLRKINEVAEVARGKSKHRPRNDKSLFGGDYPFIQTGDVRNAQKYITTFSTSYNEKGFQQSKLWPKDTICLTIAANIGDVAILGMDACFPDSIVGISSSELETDYLYYFLTTLQQQLDSKANAAAQKNINLKILSEIEIPVPTLNEQRDIVSKINAVDQISVRVKAEISEKITMMQQLKVSILDSAFKGEL
ncbi:MULTISPECIES: restriction endonuclease subunit S [Enterobacteriaceae]|uniref:restriction endonuclease subunit S n=1 Tax=Enterobacteriaceae TaxID=543 RepID=UPI0011075961|nr:MULTISPECIES: restriction endonuclease subunit S [Enterobacteriaceae]NSM59128.1 restriction endonuclease subunit S [Klebsiella variicola]TLU67995.1 restriction endonuclease subunit S [Enterobacter sp. MF024]